MHKYMKNQVLLYFYKSKFEREYLILFFKVKVLLLKYSSRECTEVFIVVLQNHLRKTNTLYLKICLILLWSIQGVRFQKISFLLGKNNKQLSEKVCKLRYCCYKTSLKK